MMPSIPQQRYSPISIALHWIMLLLLVAVYACMELREFYPRGSDLREGLKTWHYMLGLTVLLLAVARMIAHFARRAPPITPEPPAWQTLLAKGTHFALYAFMLGMPIAGWTILSAEGDAIPFFGLQLPGLVGHSESLAKQVQEVHETVGTIGYFLVGFHALAALFHHYIVKDDTLRRMLPGKR